MVLFTISVKFLECRAKITLWKDSWWKWRLIFSEFQCHFFININNLQSRSWNAWKGEKWGIISPLRNWRVFIIRAERPHTSQVAMETNLEKIWDRIYLWFASDRSKILFSIGVEGHRPRKSKFLPVHFFVIMKAERTGNESKSSKMTTAIFTLVHFCLARSVWGTMQHEELFLQFSVWTSGGWHVQL